MPTYYSRSNYTGDGATTQRAVSFPFLLRSHVKVYLDDVETTAFTWIHDGLINITTPPAVDVAISIRRETPIDELIVDYMDGATLVESDLDNAQLQVHYIVQELVDRYTVLITGIELDADTLDGLDSLAFALASHSHIIADTTGLQTALDGKSATGHTHLEADITDLGNYTTVGHTHVEADITDLGSYASASHTHLEADITDLGNYTTVGHTHVEADITDLGNYSTVGHTHLKADVTDLAAIEDSDFSAAEGFMRKTGAGAYEAIKSNLSAVVAPTVNDDTGAGYAIGSRWIDVTADKEYVCLDVTAAAAVWTETTGAGGGGGGDVAVEDEGTEILAAATRLNFAGAAVTVTDAGANEALITIDDVFAGGGELIAELNSSSVADVEIDITGYDRVDIVWRAVCSASTTVRGGLSADLGTTYSTLQRSYTSKDLEGETGGSNLLWVGGEAAATDHYGRVVLDAAASSTYETNATTWGHSSNSGMAMQQSYYVEANEITNMIKFHPGTGTFTTFKAYVVGYKLASGINTSDRSAITRHSANQAITANTWTKLTCWNATAELDPISLWDGANDRYLIPAGVTRVRPQFSCGVGSDTGADWGMKVERNAGGVSGGGDLTETDYCGDVYFNNTASFPIMTVAEGDTIEAFIYVRTTGDTVESGYFELQVIE